MEYRINSYITAGSIISSLGFGTEENFSRIREYRSGIARVEDTALFDTPFMAARIDNTRLKVLAQELDGYTRMEQLFILSLSDTIRQSGIDPADPGCGMIISTTKGNIDLLFGKRDLPVLVTQASQSREDTLTSAGKTDFPGKGRASSQLYEMAMRVAGHFGCVNEPVVISNACISGVSALIVASRLIEAGKYKHILVAGGDLLTRFVVTGFQSFKSVSPEICKPYDKARDGLSLGEACAGDFRPGIGRGGTAG